MKLCHLQGLTYNENAVHIKQLTNDSNKYKYMETSIFCVLVKGANIYLSKRDEQSKIQYKNNSNSKIIKIESNRETRK